MRWKKCLRLSLPAFCCLASLQWTFAAVTSTTESLKVEETAKGGEPKPCEWEYPKPCYVEKSKVEELIVQMNSTVRILNRGDGNLQCQEKLEIKLVDAEDIEICSEERIQRIQKDLFKVAGSLFQHAIRLTEPSEEDVDFLDLIKFRLVKDLRALRVFYGSLPCDSYKIALFPFQRLITPVRESLDQVYSLLKSARPTRLPPPTPPATPTTTPPATTPKPTINDMLNPEKSFAELMQMAELNPSAMTKALPQIISARYNERTSTFDKLLAFAQALPTIENQVFGFSAIYDEMHRYIRDPEFSKLAKLAESVKLLNESEATSLNFTDTTDHMKLLDLIHDLSPIAAAMATTSAPTTTSAKPKPTIDDMLSPEKSFVELTEMARMNPSAMTKAISQIISQRYNERNSTFDKLLTFVQDLPSIENQVFGFAAVYDEMHRYIRDPDFSKLAKLAEGVKLLNESEATSLNFTDTTAHMKLLDLIHDLSPIAAAMVTTSTPITTSAKPKPSLDDMLDLEKSFAELKEMAKSNPSAMSRALPKIVSQRYSRRVSAFDSLLDFVNAMPTTENKIIGFSAVYDEMHGYNQKPDALQLGKLAKNVRHILASVPTTLNVVAKSKLDELTEDPDLNPLISILNPEKSLKELAKWAHSNPTAMSIALPEIISERYNGSDSQIEALLKFVEGLPTTENKIIGFIALHDEILRYGQDRTLNSAQLLKLAKKVKILNEYVQASSMFSNSATELKWTNLMRDLSPLMLIGEKANCNVTNVAYGTQLTADDYDWPFSAYVYQDQTKATLQIYPAIQNYKLVFRIGHHPLFASDTNTNTDSRTKYQTKTSERYVLRDWVRDLPTNAEIDWKLVAVPAKVNQFRILSAKYDDFMFAHKSETGYRGYRRVLLGKKSYSNHDHIPNADIWTLDCKPGTFSIPSL